jgi:hypothetical protein
MAARMAIIATTIISSIRVKPACTFFMCKSLKSNIKKNCCGIFRFAVEPKKIMANHDNLVPE